MSSTSPALQEKKTFASSQSSTSALSPFFLRRFLVSLGFSPQSRLRSKGETREGYWERSAKEKTSRAKEPATTGVRGPRLAVELHGIQERS